MRKGTAIAIGAVAIAGLVSVAGTRTHAAPPPPEGCVVDGPGYSVGGGGQTVVAGPNCAHLSTLPGKYFLGSANSSSTVTLQAWTNATLNATGTACNTTSSSVQTQNVSATGKPEFPLLPTYYPIQPGWCVQVSASGQSGAAVGTLTGTVY